MMIRKMWMRALVSMLLASLLAAPADACGRFGGRRPRGAMPTWTWASPGPWTGSPEPAGSPAAAPPAPAAEPARPAPAPSPAPASGFSATPAAGTISREAAAFLAWLNATRASYGLPPVAYDASLETECHQNNVRQAVHGLGHWFLGRCRRQNAAWNLGFPGVESAWIASPGHAAALLDPGITRIAITWHGAWCTFGAN